MYQKFLLIDFYSWSELSGSLMADRKLVQKIQVQHATASRGVAVSLIQEYVSLIKKCNAISLSSTCIIFDSKHTIGMLLLRENKNSTRLTWQHTISRVTAIILLLLNS